MTRSQILAVCCPNEGEQKLKCLLNNINEGNDKALADILTFKNSLLLGKTNLTNDELNFYLLKNYVLHLFGNKEVGNNEVSSLLLNKDYSKLINLLDSNISVRYYLSYLYITMSKNDYVSNRIFQLENEKYDTIINILSDIQSLYSERQLNSKLNIRCRQQVSAR